MAHVGQVGNIFTYVVLTEVAVYKVTFLVQCLHETNTLKVCLIELSFIEWSIFEFRCRTAISTDE